MDIMLHVGAHRCASTTFQSFLWANRIQLAGEGLTCWTPKRTRDGLMRGLMQHPAIISIADERNGLRSIGRMRIEMDRLSRNGQRGLLISEENLIGSIMNNMLDTRLYPLLRERLMRFEPAFEGRRLRIGLCVRSYEDYWTSCLANLVTRGRMVPDADLLDFLTTQPRRWRTMVRDIASVFPSAEIIVWPFERMAGRPDAMLETLWEPTSARLQQREVWRNRSSSLVHLNNVMALRGDRPLSDGPVDAAARWMPFDEDQRSVLRAEYRRDLTWLMAGAEGLARFVDGRSASAQSGPDGRSASAQSGDTGRSASTPTPSDGQTMPAHDMNSGRTTPVSQPDRADVTRTSVSDAVLFGGRKHGIKEGMGRTGAG